MKVAGVKFRDSGKIYDFNAGDLNLYVNDRVVVGTEKGVGIGTVVKMTNLEDITLLDKSLKKILRKADENDLNAEIVNQEKEKEIHKICLNEIQNCNLPMKLVEVECLFDGSKIIFYFTSESRVDFRELVKRLAQRLHTKIEMRQIGVRNETKMVGGIGNCGREFCCSTFLKGFEPVSIKIAKDQNLALNPAKISGVCGRLMCCLAFEHETYVDFKKDMPKIGQTLLTLQGRGRVVEQNIIGQKVIVELEDGKEVKVSISGIKEEGTLRKHKKKR
ncbi:MAG: regulatory iron-sulfur-containing complex subunit RicT [Thermodesulfobacteriota bacterium]